MSTAKPQRINFFYGSKSFDSIDTHFFEVLIVYKTGGLKGHSCGQ